VVDSIPYKLYGYLLSAAFLITCLFAAWLSMPQLLLLPFVLLFCAWATDRPRQLLFLLLICIPWSVEFSVTESLGTDLPDEPLMLLAAFITLVFGIHYRKKIVLKKVNHPLLWILFLQLAWLMVAVYFSTHVLISVKYLLAKTWYLLSFFVAPLFLFRKESFLKKCAIGVSVSMLSFVLLTLFRHALHGFTFATINESLEPFFRNHVNYSATLVFIIPVFFAGYKLTCDKAYKRFFLIAVIVLLVALYFSYARGAWLALLIGILALCLLKNRVLLPAFLFFTGLVFTLLVWLQSENNYVRFANHYNTTIFHTNFEEHLIATYRLQDVSTAERFYRWVAGVRMISDRWQTGYGPNTFYENYKPYAVPAFKTWVSDNKDRSTVHNYFLLTFIEQGVIGFLLLLLLIGAFFWYAQKIYRKAKDPFWKTVTATITVIFSMICTVNFLSDLVETDKVGSFYYLCIALLLVADLKTRAEPNT
jgi:O-antigen ligase